MSEKGRHGEALLLNNRDRECMPGHGLVCRYRLEYLWSGWTHIRMQILLTFVLCQLAGEARLGKRNQIVFQGFVHVAVIAVMLYRLP